MLGSTSSLTSRLYASALSPFDQPCQMRAITLTSRRSGLQNGGYPVRMPTYQRLGRVPRKRHIQFRDNGTLLTEEVMGMEGFSGMESILYHLQSPCRVKELGDFEPIKR